MYRVHRCVLLAVVGACCAPQIATAAVVGKDAATGTIDLAASPGEQNHVDVDRLPPPSFAMRITDSGAALTVVAGCVLDGATAICGDPDDDTPVRVNFALGDRDDFASTFRPVLDSSTLFGEGGDDELWSSGNDSWAYGGTGSDEIHTSNNFGGQSFGGPGDDRMTGHSGTDHFFGEEGDDTLVSGGQIVVFEGGPGEDHLVGRDAEFGVLRGDGGDDVLHLTGIGSPTGTGIGPYTLEAGGGDDILNGGTDQDTFDAGPGDDRLHAWDGGPDTVNCGPGSDTAYVDAADTVAGDCERIRLAPRAALGAIADRLAARSISGARAMTWRARALESLGAATAEGCYEEARLRVSEVGEACFDRIHGAVRRLTVIDELAPQATDIARDIVAVERDIAAARRDDADGALASSKPLSAAEHFLRKAGDRHGLSASLTYRQAWLRLLDSPGRIPGVRCAC